MPNAKETQMNTQQVIQAYANARVEADKHVAEAIQSLHAARQNVLSQATNDALENSTAEWTECHEKLMKLLKATD